jgi:2-polyprenyl-3-methyl-5-hydroxy-6-metoxy-1,4-benzoquinol methylase
MRSLPKPAERRIVRHYQLAPKQTSCPVCATSEAHLLWTADSEQAAQHFVLREKHSKRHFDLVSHIESLWGQSTCEVLRCDHCGFCYSDPYIAGDERFYDLAYDRVAYPRWKWEFQVTYDVLTRFSTSGLRLLEIGAGDGAFVKRVACELLPRDSIFCTEFSKYGKREIEKLGVQCFSEDIRDLSSQQFDESLDIVCMFQVLEHMDRLGVLFAALNALMKVGGSLFIAVPNHRRIEFNELNGALLDMPPNHVGRWTRECFEAIGKQNGFDIEDYRVEESSFPVMAAQFASYRFLRRAQRSGSFENRVQTISNGYLLRMMQAIGVIVDSAIAIPVFMKMNSGIGNSQWVHFIKAR